MKDILSALKTAIPAGMSAIKGAHVVTDPDYLPPAVRFPCVGLKDADDLFSEGMAQTESEKGTIQIYIYVQILKDEASIMGDGINKGVLELMKDLRTLLNWNNLGGIIHHAYIPDVFASEIALSSENVFVQRKGCRLVYER